MASFLIAAWPVPGHINPTLAIAHALRERGHEVAFYTGESTSALIEGEGFRCFAFKRVDEDVIQGSEHPGFYSASPLERMRAIPKLKAGLRRWLLDTVPAQVEDLEEILTQHPFDLILTVESMWGPFLVLRETHGIPVAFFSTLAACLLPGPDAPAWGVGMPRPRNWAMRSGSAMIRALQRFLSRDFIAAAEGLRRGYGLAPIRTTVTEYAGTLPLYLMPSVPEFDYERRDLPPSVHYVGPCVWDKPRTQSAPAWLDELPSDRPVVHVTEATIHSHDPLLLKAAAEGLADLPLQVVMTTGQHRDPKDLDLGHLAPNIRVEAYVPHSDLMPRCSVLVTLGGAGTVFAALKAGVPLIIVPTEWDKPENAQRVVEAGAGLRIAPKRCTPERLRAAVEKILADPAYRQGAQRLADACARYAGAPLAGELLEALAADSTSLH